jgi:hypothetical protein
MKYEKNLTDISDKDRFFCYAWSYDGWGKNTTKLGDTWVPAGSCAYAECAARIRQSAQVLKHEFDSGRMPIHAIWDVSDYAKKNGKFKMHGKIDSTLGDEVGLRVKDDLYNRSPDDLVGRVNKILTKAGQPLPVCGLTAWQYRAVYETLVAVNNGATTILSDMCARAGKTLYIGAVVKESNVPVTIVASYVLTSFTSFVNDLSSFEQFKNIELIDSKDDDYKARVKSARKEGKQVIVFLSLCKGGIEKSKRDERIKFLFGLNNKVMLVIDEADYGAWKSGQSDPLVKHRREDDIVIIMTGTNSDRAIGGWNIGSIVQVTYPEMLMEKYHHLPVKTTPEISNFAIDVSRHALVVDVKFYQMGLKSVVESARAKNPDLFVDEGQFAPSWSKFSKSPVKAKGFWTYMLQAVFNGKHGHDEANFDLQRGVQNDSGVYMMFLPSNMKLVNLKEAALIAQESLPNFSIVTLSSINGVSNYNAQRKTKEQIEVARKDGKKVLILATCIAQRSFSVGEISAVFLAYDNGEAGATIQKISRGLTPDEVGKVGRIVSLSFDPRRDDKFDSVVLQTAINYQKTHKLPSIKDSLDIVLKTIDIFDCTENGAIKIDVDAYLEEIVTRERISKVVGKMANVSNIGDNLRECILNSNFSRYVPQTDEVAEKGKSFAKKNRSNKKKNPQRKDEDAIIREKIVALCENLDVVVLGTNSKNMAEAVNALKVSKELQISFEEESGIPYQALEELVTNNVINSNLIDLIKY